jgi:hypothetical protein
VCVRKCTDVVVHTRKSMSKDKLRATEDMHRKTKNGALRTGPGSSKFRSHNYTIMSINLLYLGENYFSWADLNRSALRDCSHISSISASVTAMQPSVQSFRR